MASVIMVIFLMPTVCKACSSPRRIDIILASVEVMQVTCIFGLCYDISGFTRAVGYRPAVA